jgi:hypothetical protein
MATNLERMYGVLDSARGDLVTRLQENDCFPDRPAVIVPLAISLALVTQSTRQTILLASNIGGDTDSVASIGGAIAAAMWPETVDDEWYQAVERVNNLNLIDLATTLHKIRSG